MMFRHQSLLIFLGVSLSTSCIEAFVPGTTGTSFLTTSRCRPIFSEPEASTSTPVTEVETETEVESVTETEVEAAAETEVEAEAETEVESADETAVEAAAETEEVVATDGEEKPKPKQKPKNRKDRQNTAYVVNLSYETTNADLYEVFGAHGKVESVYLPMNRATKKPKGIAFVSMSTEEELTAVIDALQETQLGGRTVYVSKAQPKGEVGEKTSMTKMYIGNISFDTTSDELLEHFGQWGQVKDCYLPLDRETNEPRGFAFLTMNPEGAEAAIENADGTEFGGRTIEVKVSLPRGQKAPQRERPVTTKLYIGNLSYDTEEDVLYEVLGQYGDITDLYMPIDRYSGERRGFAFVTVENNVATQIIEELDGFELDGRILRVNEARPKGAPAPVQQYNDYGEEGDGYYDEDDGEEGEEGEEA